MTMPDCVYECLATGLGDCLFIKSLRHVHGPFAPTGQPFFDRNNPIGRQLWSQISKRFTDQMSRYSWVLFQYVFLCHVCVHVITSLFVVTSDFVLPATFLAVIRELRRKLGQILFVPRCHLHVILAMLDHFSSSSVSAVVTHSFAVNGYDYCVAPTISDDRPMASIKDETLAFVFLDEIPDGLVNLDVLLLLHGKILCENSWRVVLILFDFVGPGELVQFLNQVQPLEGDVKVGILEPIAGKITGVAALHSTPESFFDECA